VGRRLVQAISRRSDLVVHFRIRRGALVATSSVVRVAALFAW
jgi:hypothetical protein